MSLTKLKHDLSFWINSEDSIKTIMEKKGWEMEGTDDMAIHDFIAKKDWKTYSLELKTRRCNKDQYNDTLIGANKLAEAWKHYYKSWMETLFLFKYEDGLYYLNPLNLSPRREYKLQRFDRGGVDAKKWWLYYDTTNLILI